MVGQQGNSDTTNSKNRTAKDEQQKKFAPIHTGMSQPKTIYLEYVASIFKGKKPLKNLNEEKFLRGKNQIKNTSQGLTSNKIQVFLIQGYELIGHSRAVHSAWL